MKWHVGGSVLTGPPIFDVIVELDRGFFNEWHVVPDVGKAVDSILEKSSYVAQVRKRNETAESPIYVETFRFHADKATEQTEFDSIQSVKVAISLRTERSKKLASIKQCKIISELSTIINVVEEILVLIRDSGTLHIFWERLAVLMLHDGVRARNIPLESN